MFKTTYGTGEVAQWAEAVWTGLTIRVQFPDPTGGSRELTSYA